MRVKRREMNGAVVLDISGEMYGGPENTQLMEILDTLGQEGKLEAILNLEKVRHIASNGLGILVRARARYLKHGGRLSICGATSQVLSIIYVTKMNIMFDVYDTCDEALAMTKR